MGHTFECPKCGRAKTEVVPNHSANLMCQACRRALVPPPTTEQRGLPPPPPMRTPHHSRTPGLGPMLVVLVFVAGVAIGAKMAGGW